jgi:hypothetical protein
MLHPEPARHHGVKVPVPDLGCAVACVNDSVQALHAMHAMRSTVRSRACTHKGNIAMTTLHALLTVGACWWLVRVLA